MGNYTNVRDVHWCNPNSKEPAKQIQQKDLIVINKTQNKIMF